MSIVGDILEEYYAKLAIENAIMRKALEEIANGTSSQYGIYQHIAREALNNKGVTNDE